MLKKIWNLAPLWLVKILARKMCGGYMIQGKVWRKAFNDVLVRDKEGVLNKKIS